MDDMRLLCLECGHVGKPEELSDYVGEKPHGQVITWLVCAHCYSDDVVEWHECPECLRAIPKNQEFCERCIDRTVNTLQAVIRALNASDTLLEIAMERILEGR